MPLELTDADYVRSILQRDEGDDTEQDALISALIPAASQAITNYCQREFLPTSSESRVFAYSGSGVLDLGYYDLRSVTSITINPDADSPTVLTSDQYTLRPKPSRFGVYQWIKIPKQSQEVEVEISGAWGFATVPEDVGYWTAITVITWLRDYAIAGGNGPDPENQLRPESIPVAVRFGLQLYQRPKVG